MTENEAIEFMKRYLDADCYTDKCVNAHNIAINALEEIQQYRAIGMVEECREAVEKQTAISREIIEGKYFCPKCHNPMPYPGYCGCGQKLY
ncbi:hypothetical protein DW650_18745 [Roseburia sp. AM23-20]|uniref:hypothetical protein n=1 Tax=Roseburia sp. AM23-20 TaxID=2292066 RepID=UPI000E47EA7F|nr:hypothetical protein [Roseburia sp. AM23-20]RHF89922.1 hypothetical protein DW650_18745 [Roseburia sp. AM23-20]DAV78808.1 MAG TPA: zinc-ribbon containing domain protein [Caudoviricetes sp.]